MKKPVTTIETFCDCCEGIAYESDGCLSCGKVVCFKCRPEKGRKYEHAIYCSGSGDGVYCAECDQRLAIQGDDVRYNAYVKIHALRRELGSWTESFERRRQTAEAEMRALL